jgi:deoxyadenosine/deoxycytidine kinase
MRVVIVGPCAAGKTTLAARLTARGVDAHECAQEHSGVGYMWRVIARPDVLVYLDASLPTIRARRGTEYPADYLETLRGRLADARVHADFYLPTDELTPEEVTARVMEFIEKCDI